LGHPTHDPHGSPIPTPEGELPKGDPVLSLSDLPLETPAAIARVNDEDSELLRHLAEVGLVPGASVRRTPSQAPWGTLSLLVEGRETVVHSGIAPHVFVSPLSDPSPSRFVEEE
jgi:DtxR family Mn-dependent transcriptional regulator